MMIKQLTFLVICAISTVFGDDSRLKANLEEFKNCADFPDLKMSFSDIDIDYLNRTFIVVSAKLEVKEDISENVQRIVSVTKCDSKNIDSCQHFLKSEKSGGVCENIDNEGEPLYSILNSIQNFEKSCSLKQGTYEVKNAHPDILKWQLLPALEPSYYKTTVSLYDAEDMVLCIDMEFKVGRKRRS